MGKNCFKFETLHVFDFVGRGEGEEAKDLPVETAIHERFL